MALLRFTPSLPIAPVVLASCSVLVAVAPLGAATVEAKRSFDLPRGDAATTLRQFAATAGRSLVFVTDKVRGETTNPVRGEFTPREALDRMLAGSALEAAQDAATGALVVSRKRVAEVVPSKGEVRPVSDSQPKPKTTAMTSKPRSLFAALVALIAGNASAQTPQTQPTERSKGTVVLSPFEVTEGSDKSYGALNSASITRFNVEMDKLPVSADIFTEAFMKDIAASSVEDVIQGYSAGAGYASGPDNGASSAANNQPGDRNGNAYIQLRGMNTPQIQRDGFMPVGAFGNPGSTGVGRTDSFDLERIEVINGPQAMLYGGGGAGGVINVNSKAAPFNTKLKGSTLFRVDQYGSKRGEFDLGFGNKWVAVRVATLNETSSSRRVNIGGTTYGQYGQLAFRFFQETVPTTIRISTSTTFSRRRLNAGLSLTAPQVFIAGSLAKAADSRNGMSLKYLLATNQTGATNPVTGVAYGYGAILNGKLNWNNVDSFGAGALQDPVSNQLYTATVDTKWSSWLTTQVAGGYDNFTERRINSGVTFYAPNAGLNTTSDWAMGNTPSDAWQPARTKAGRVAALITKDFFGGKAKTQTLFGTDFVRTDYAIINYNWWEADANWKIIFAPDSTIKSANSGRTPLPQQRWSVNDGPVLYPFADPSLDRAVYGGVNYVREINNQPQANLITPANPMGLPNTTTYNRTKIFNKAYYGVNYTEWLDGKLTTLFGFRQGDYISDRMSSGNGKTRWITKGSATNFNLGVDWNLNRWLHPYTSFSDSVQVPFVATTDPLGDTMQSSHGIGGEAGLKFNTTDRRFSGSIAAFKVTAQNDIYGINGSIAQGINPSGLNGGGGGSSVNVDRVTTGVQAQFTAALTRNWRMRFSSNVGDGKIGTAKSYDQLYNDQFYANSAGQVTYRNGVVVYVKGDATSVVEATVLAPTEPGATPLTINMMSTPTSIYWTNPNLTSGAINSGSVTANILKGTKNTDNINANGPILTGATLLPISNLQLNKQLAGIVTPGIIVATRVGDKTAGSPERSFNFTSVYTFSETVLKGFSIGGTASLSWGNRSFYYYATPVTAANALTLRRTLFYAPNGQQFNVITSYARKLGRYHWSTQLNVSNIFNRYAIRLVPNATTGFNTPTAINATFYQQPRSMLWTNTISF